MRWYQIEQLLETSTAGSSGAGNIAVAINSTKQGSIGAGFNPDGDWGVYSKPKKISFKKATSVLKR